jgi:hypothetical protein
MNDKPDNGSQQTQGTSQTSKTPPPVLPKKEEATQADQNPQDGQAVPDNQEPPKTRFQRFKKWVWPMEFSNAVMILLTAFIALGTIVSAVAIGFQWHEMHEGGKDTTAIAKAAKQQACAAQKSAQAARDFADSAANINVGITAAVKELGRQAREVELSRNTSSETSQKALEASISNFHRDQRAWVGVIKIEGALKSNQNFSPTAYFMNSGRTPALHVRASMGVVPGVVGREPFLPTWPDNGRGSTNQFMPGVLYENSVPMTEDYKKIIESGDFLTELNSGSRTVYVMGRFDYTDTFGEPHWTTFCHFITQLHAWVACTKYNESDQETK